MIKAEMRIYKKVIFLYHSVPKILPNDISKIYIPRVALNMARRLNVHKSLEKLKNNS